MGQAKRRGSYELRKNKAIEQQKEKQMQNKLEKKQYFDSLSNEEKHIMQAKQKRAERFILMSNMLSNF